MDFMKAINVIFRYKVFTSEEEEEQTVQALDDVSLTINKGDFIAILGHNGSGKSTLAKQLAGLLHPTEGCILIRGLDSGRPENNITIRKTAGIVFQNPDNQLIGNIVEEDIAFGPENLGVPKEEIWERVSNALAATGMTAYRFKSPRALSGGQKQKIAISGILAMEPECIILDEPTAMLDPKGRKEVLQAIHHLNKSKNITIILITHHMEEAEDADYIYVMKKGKIMAQGMPPQIWPQHDLIKDCGIGLPFDRTLVDELRDEHIEIPVGVNTEEDLLYYLVESNSNLMRMLGGYL
ncbi:MAG: energy-coupling factor transporter ATPase [Eubacteriales bacterium]|nr:energy-coupling factor transporter ATPase [Eubacteriales bacterium]